MRLLENEKKRRYCHDQPYFHWLKNTFFEKQTALASYDALRAGKYSTDSENLP